MRVTRKEVAEEANVSVATVSNVINFTKNVTPEVKQRVLAAIEKLQYRPNIVARSLASNKSKHVAMIVDNMQNPHYNEMLEGAQKYASSIGYLISVIPIQSSSLKSISDILGRGIDGAISTVQETCVKEHMTSSVPTVRLDNSINLQYKDAIFEMVKTLKDYGHKKIAFLSGLKLSNETHIRYHFFIEAMEHYGLAVDHELIIDGGEDQLTDENSGFTAMVKLFEDQKDFTAVFTSNDLMAIGAMKAIKKRNLSVPEDISIVGVDNINLGKWLSPTLSTIDIYSYELGKSLMQVLVSEIENTEFEKQSLIAKFIPRESIGKAKR